MLIITIKTDQPDSEVGLFIDSREATYLKWYAHFELAEKLHQKASNLLEDINKNWHDLGGIVVFKGPGSFTGLRIGITFANTLAYSLDVPIIGTSGKDWLDLGIDELYKNKNDGYVVPAYGSEAHITLPKSLQEYLNLTGT